MARLPKYADAIVQDIVQSPKAWNKVRAAATQVVDAEKIVDVRKILADFSPEKYLLTHATIVASVDVEAKPLSKDGHPYFIKPECSKYVNQNGDSWERGLLLNTFRTFVGAYNYLEHVQIPQLSKGRVIDAVARPVNNNESVYIDILVATSRIHRDLVASIESGELGTLSMGCSIKYSRCSKCGKKASDEVDLCDCIRYLKNQYFMDNDGNKRIIAELCGDANDPDSNVFIEASWVKNPAFQGAVLRNIILAQGEDEKKFAEKIEKAYVARKNEPTTIDGFLKAASVKDLEAISKKAQSIKYAKMVLAEAGVDPFDHPSDEDKDAREEEPQEEGKLEKAKQMVGEETPDEGPDHSQAEDADEEPAQESGMSMDGEQDQNPPSESEPKEQVTQSDASDQSGDENQTQAAGEESEGEENGEAPAEGEDQAGDQEAPDYNKQFEQALEQDQGNEDQGGEAEGQEAQPEGGAQEGQEAQQPGAQPPAQGAAPKADSFDAIKDQVKKEIRQSIIDELTKEIQDEQGSYLDSHEGNEDWDGNENLVKAFVNVYKPKTGFSSAKLSSIFNMLYLYDAGKDFSKIAYRTDDLVDFFEFVDRFQVTENPLLKWHYGVLRKASQVDVSGSDEFKTFLNQHSIRGKTVVEAMVKKAKVIHDYFKGRSVKH